MTGTTTAPAAQGPTAPAPPVRRLRLAVVYGGALLAVLLLAAVHLTQGTSGVGAADLLRLLTGDTQGDAARVLVASRLPRLLAGVVVGVALGCAGAAFQSVARNPLASPDTLGVNAGTHLAVVLAAVVGLSLPALPAGVVAFAGGVAAAALVMAVSAGGTSGPTRLVLAGSATAIALSSVTTLLLILHEEETLGLFAWGNGSLVQSDLAAVRQLAPVVAVGVALLLAFARRLDLLALGDDTAHVLGVPVRRTRLHVTLLAVLLSAAAVTLVGPLGFVGLCAPVIARLLTPLVPGLQRHAALVPLAGLAGVLVVLGADVALRAVAGAAKGVEIPTGTVTTVLGAVVLIALARRFRDSGPTRRAPSAALGRLRSARAHAALVGVAASLVAGALVAGMLLGDTLVLTGDVWNWLHGRTGPGLTFVLDARYPRVLGALLAGAAMALAGAVVQAVCRNPLAEPGILGVTAGAGVGAVTVLTLAPTAGLLAMSSAATAGALLTFGLVYLLSWRRGLSSDRLVLIGIAMLHGCTALTALVVVATDPWNTGKALTWLSGSTYGRTPEQVVPVAAALAVFLPLVLLLRRELDLLAIDDDTPRVLGVRLERTRLAALLGAALVTAAAVSAVGVVGFVGLVAPHAARALVGSRHTRLVPLAVLLGALLVSVADTVGRTVIAPAQIPAGLVTALVGTPYFVWLLWRSRTRTTT